MRAEGCDMHMREWQGMAEAVMPPSERCMARTYAVVSGGRVALAIVVL